MLETREIRLQFKQGYYVSFKSLMYSLFETLEGREVTVEEACSFLYSKGYDRKIPCRRLVVLFFKYLSDVKAGKFFTGRRGFKSRFVGFFNLSELKDKIVENNMSEDELEVDTLSKDLRRENFEKFFFSTLQRFEGRMVSLAQIREEFDSLENKKNGKAIFSKERITPFLKQLELCGLGEIKRGSSRNTTYFISDSNLSELSNPSFPPPLKEEITPSESDSFTHRYWLRADFQAMLRLPSDLTQHEAARLAAFFKTLPL